MKTMKMIQQQAAGIASDDAMMQFYNDFSPEEKEYMDLGAWPQISKLKSLDILGSEPIDVPPEELAKIGVLSGRSAAQVRDLFKHRLASTSFTLDELAAGVVNMAADAASANPGMFAGGGASIFGGGLFGAKK